METTTQHSPSPLRLSEAAARRIRKVVTQENNPDLMVRLEVLGGGCSGFQYRFGFESTAHAEEDVIIEREGARLVVDKTSLDLLIGSEVDYGESLMESGFRVNNPNAVSSCGCGTSFAIGSSD